MSNALKLSVKPEQIAELEAVVAECNLQVISADGQFEQTFKMAAGMKKIGEMITADMMTDIMALQNTSLGFRTDKEGGYDVATVKACLIEATLRGVHSVGNEFNIISKRPYITKEGFARLVREYPGLTDLRLSPGVPHMKNGGAIVVYKASWKLDGTTQSLERELPVRVNKGMGSDAIIGKATRKMLAAIYGQLTGSEHAVPEGEVGDVVDEARGRTKAAPSDLNEEIQTVTQEQSEAADGDLFDKSQSAVEAGV